MDKQQHDEQWIKATLGRVLARKIVAYMKDPEHQREFENWYLKRYGVPYQKRRKNGN